MNHLSSKMSKNLLEIFWLSQFDIFDQYQIIECKIRGALKFMDLEFYSSLSFETKFKISNSAKYRITTKKMGDSVKKEIGNRLETTFHIRINWDNITDQNRLSIIGKNSNFTHFPDLFSFNTCSEIQKKNLVIFWL